MKVNNKGVGKRIKNIRKSRGENQTEFGNLFSTSKSNVSNWEKQSNRKNC